MGFLNAFYPSIELEYWTEFWIFVGILCTISALCLIFIKRRWLKHTLGWFLITFSIPIIGAAYLAPYQFARPSIDENMLFEVAKLEIEKGNVKLEKYIPYMSFASGPINGSRDFLGCGNICANLVLNGYTDKFVNQYYLGVKVKNSNSRTFGEKIEYVSIDKNLDAFEVSKDKFFEFSHSCYWVEKKNWWYDKFKFIFRFRICNLDNKFSRIEGGIDAIQSAFRPSGISYRPRPATIFSHLYWFEVYDRIHNTN